MAVSEPLRLGRLQYPGSAEGPSAGQGPEARRLRGKSQKAVLPKPTEEPGLCPKGNGEAIHSKLIFW